jgi:hypothetical protein
MTEVTTQRNITTSMQEINYLQNEIEIYTKKIEHEKINLRLAKERRQKQLENLLLLQGKPIPKTKEQKEKEKREKKGKQKNRKPLYINNNSKTKEGEDPNPVVLCKELNKNETELDRVS